VGGGVRRSARRCVTGAGARGSGGPGRLVGAAQKKPQVGASGTGTGWPSTPVVA
jgi:hypothetical protein